MQVQPNSGTSKATTDDNIKRYKVSETFGWVQPLAMAISLSHGEAAA